MKAISILVLALITFTLAQNNNQVFKGIVGRRWYFGGSFNLATQTDGTNLTTSNFVSWNGTHWENIGVGTPEFPNGVVNVIQTDLCRNVYVGGSFSAVGKSTTGPAARYNTFKKTWEQIGVSGDVTWSADAKVNDIAVNCRNWPDSSLQCPCSVYLVGRFTATIKSSGKVATNVIKFEFKTKQWDDLGGATAHGMGTGEVNAVYVKEFGATEAIDNVWFAGSFPTKFQKANTKEGFKWGFTDATVPNKINGNINSIYYKIETGTTTDKVYIAGNFTGLPAATGTCERVCYFDYKTEKFYAVGTSNIPNDVVNYVELNSGVVFIGGLFTNPTTKYVAKLSTAGAWEPLSANDGTVVTSPVTVIDVCNPSGSLQVDCTGGSTGIAGSGQAKYFDAKSGSWSDFGRGIVGSTFTVQSQFSSASTLSFGVCLFITFVSTLLIVF